MASEDFKKALARVQTDYGFYISCQTDPARALGGYDLSSDERSTLMDTEKLADLAHPGSHGHDLRKARLGQRSCATGNGAGEKEAEGRS